jgi:hypothetical protein
LLSDAEKLHKNVAGSAGLLKHEIFGWRFAAGDLFCLSLDSKDTFTCDSPGVIKQCGKPMEWPNLAIVDRCAFSVAWLHNESA